MKNRLKIIIGTLVLGGMYVFEINYKNEIIDYFERKVDYSTILKGINESEVTLNDYEDLNHTFNTIMGKIKEEYKMGIVSEVKIKLDNGSSLFEVKIIDKNIEYELFVDSRDLNIILEESDSDDDVFLSNEKDFLPEEIIPIGNILQELEVYPSNSTIEEIEFQRGFNQSTWKICKFNGEETVVDATSGKIIGEYIDD